MIANGGIGIIMDSTGQMIDSRKFYSIFKGRTDRVALYNANTCKVISLEVKKGEWEITERIKSHLGGQARLGMHNHLSDNTCTWANIIFDESTQTPTARESTMFARECSKLGLTNVKREKTKVKGENYACWMFFDKPISAKKIRHLINLIFKKLDITKAEILPKEDLLTSGSSGGYAWLPYFGGTDKWIEGNGETRMDMGAKLGHTIFLDNEGNQLKDPFGKIHKYTENEIDNAILYLTEYIPSESSPEEGTKILDAHLKKMSDKCCAVRGMLNEIKETKGLKEEAVNALGLILKAFGREDYFHKIMSGTAGYDKELYDKKLASLSGTAFLPCSTFREMGYCNQEADCFAKRAPLIERYGKIEEDKHCPPEQWREFSPALWAFQGIKERMSEEADVETALIDVDVIDQGEYFETFKKELMSKRSRLIEKRKQCSGFDTGFNSLNQLIDGLCADSLTIVSAAQGSGKTAFCTQIMEYASQNEKAAGAYITYGESQHNLTAKMIARSSGIDYRKVLRGALADEELNRVTQALKTLKTNNGKYIYVVEGNDSMTIKKIKTIIDALPIQLLIVDTLQMVPFFSQNNIHDLSSRLEQVVRQLKTLARYKKIPVIAVYSSRDKDMNIADLIAQESMLMAACDSWVHLEEKGVMDGAQGIKEYGMLIRKNRNGEKNILVKIGYQSAYQKFVETK